MELHRGRRRSGWDPVTRGVHVRAADEVPRWWAQLHGWQDVLAGDGVLSHLTAARVHGWWLPAAIDAQPVFAALDTDRRVRRPGLAVSRHRDPLERTVVGGLAVTSPRDTLLTCAADLGLLDLVVLADAALSRGVARDDLLPVRPRQPGGVLVRAALRLADPRAESPWESVLRMLHLTADVAVRAQHVVTHEGQFVARADLWIEGTRTLPEYDGAVHRDPEQHRADLDRDRALARAGWRRNGYTAREVVRRPHVVVRDADEALDRAWDPLRVRRWQIRLAASMLGARRGESWTAWTDRVGHLVRTERRQMRSA